METSHSAPREVYPDAHYNLGIVLAKQDKLDEAMASYQRALRLKPDYRDAHLNLGIVLANQGRLDEAVACYQEALPQARLPGGALESVAGLAPDGPLRAGMARL